jgi:hypothetical protein|uniref:Uncharacterized protein n=1 Tax=Caldisericum exile TaxID=693075 RepID=A0A7C4TVA8_9BACT
MKKEVIDKYVKDLPDLLEEVRKIPKEEIRTFIGQTPPYENMIIFLFGYLFKFFKFEELPQFNNTFPDALIAFDGELLPIEFEVFSSDFKRHEYDKEMRYLIVCWRHDWDKCPNNIDVLALEDFWNLAKEKS